MGRTGIGASSSSPSQERHFSGSQPGLRSKLPLLKTTVVWATPVLGGPAAWSGAAAPARPISPTSQRNCLTSEVHHAPAAIADASVASSAAPARWGGLPSVDGSPMRCTFEPGMSADVSPASARRQTDAELGVAAQHGEQLVVAVRATPLARRRRIGIFDEARRISQRSVTLELVDDRRAGWRCRR